MPSEIYELVAQAARYWFLLLMALIVWRSYRWYRRDKRQAKKRLKLLPDAGYVGEMVVIEGGEALKRGQALPVPREGTLGTLRTNDLCIPAQGVAKKHLWFRFDEGQGLMVEPMRGCAASVDGEPFMSRRAPLYMAHGSRLRVGEAELRLRLFAGFESTGYAARREGAEEPPPQRQDPPPEAAQTAAMAQQLAMQQWMLQQQYMMQQQMQQQAAYQQWLMQQAAEQQVLAEEPEMQDAPPERDDSIFMRPADEPAPRLPLDEALEPEPEETPEADGDEWPYAPNPYGGAPWEEDPGAADMDEDMTDAAAPPRSAYVGHDEAERAKRKVWDRYFGGGHAR